MHSTRGQPELGRAVLELPASISDPENNRDCEITQTSDAEGAGGQRQPDVSSCLTPGLPHLDAVSSLLPLVKIATGGIVWDGLMEAAVGR